MSELKNGPNYDKEFKELYGKLVINIGQLGTCLDNISSLKLLEVE